MGIEGQFRGLTAPIRSEPAFVKEGRGNGYRYDIRRFAMLEKNHEGTSNNDDFVVGSSAAVA